MAEDKKPTKEEAKKNVDAVKRIYHPDRFHEQEDKDLAHEAICGLEDEYHKKYNNKKKVNGT